MRDLLEYDGQPNVYIATWSKPCCDNTVRESYKSSSTPITNHKKNATFTMIMHITVQFCVAQYHNRNTRYMTAFLKDWQSTLTIWRPHWCYDLKASHLHIGGHLSVDASDWVCHLYNLTLFRLCCRTSSYSLRSQRIYIPKVISKWNRVLNSIC